MDTFLLKSKEAVGPIFQLPIYTPKTILIGISNSLGFYSNILEYYGKFPLHNSEQLIFETNTGKEIETILKEKLKFLCGSEELAEKVMTTEAFHYVGAKVAKLSGDLRIAFDICKTALENKLNLRDEEPIRMSRIADVYESKYKSRLNLIIQTLPRDMQIILAAIYLNLEENKRELYSYKEVSLLLKAIRFI